VTHAPISARVFVVDDPPAGSWDQAAGRWAVRLDGESVDSVAVKEKNIEFLD